MPLVQSQGDKFSHIQSDLDGTFIERWRVSTSYSQRSSDLRSSLKSESWDPRSSSKTASWTTAAHRVVRLEKVQEDEEGDDYPAYQPGLSQIPMETNDQIDAHPTILNSPTHDLTNPFPSAFDDSEDILLRCRRDPRNIVLDSVQPEIAPHIVITPPEFDWSDYSTMQDNTAPLQRHPDRYLCVPGPGPTPLLATAPTGKADQQNQGEGHITGSEELENGSLPDNAAPVDGVQPMRVFSPSLFMEMIKTASEEREIIPHLLRSLYKRLFSTCAAFASDVAHSLHTRYSSPTSMSELFSHLEKPITWSDPASPLLSCFRRFPGTLIIDSVTPFTVPHIAITEPPIWDYNPYVNMHNSTQTPQDAGWGQYLVVPSPVVDFANLPEDVPLDFGESTSGYSTVVQYAESEVEGDMWEPESPSEGSIVGSPASTTLQTSGLLTPIDEEEEFDPMVFTSSSLQGSDISPVGGGDLLLEGAPQDAEIFCDDEDDDLPPLDSWYQDIATRSGYVLST